MRLVSWLLVASMLVLAFMIKAPSIEEGAPNLEATYHVLLTTTALAESPVSEHHLLPTVTLGGKYDHFIPWGSAVLMASGHYVYTSFPVASFLAPLSYFELTGQPPGRTALFQFALLLQTAVVAALAVFLLKWLRVMGQPEPVARRAMLAGVVVQMLSAEALLAYGAIYWAQQLYQLVLILSLICLLEVLKREAPHDRWWLAGLYALTVAGVLIEWTGLVFAAGVFLILYRRGAETPRLRRTAILVALAAGCALLATVIHYVVFIGWYELINAYIWRGGPRSALNASPLDLLWGYGRSFGLYLVLAAGGAWIAWRNRDALAGDAKRVGLLVLLAACFPMAENLLLAEHATVFSFDRLKLALPIAMLIAWGAAMIRTRLMAGLAVALMALTVVQNAFTFRAELQPYHSWAAIDRANQTLVDALRGHVTLSCAVVASDHRVRAYDNLLFHRGIYEDVKPGRFEAMTRTAQARQCGAVYLQGTDAFTDLSRYRQAIVWRDGKTAVVKPVS